MINGIVEDIVKSVKPKMDRSKITQRRVKEFLCYNLKTGVVKLNCNIPNTKGSKKRLYNKKGDVITSKTFVIDGVPYSLTKLLWLYVKGDYPNTDVFKIDGSKCLKFNNLTLKADSRNKPRYQINENKKRKIRTLPTQETLKYLFDYKDGLLIHRNPPKSHLFRKGLVAGHLSNDNRRTISVKGDYYDSELLISIYLKGDGENYIKYHNRKNRFKYEELLDFDYEGGSRYKSYRNGDIIDLRQE